MTLHNNRIVMIFSGVLTAVIVLFATRQASSATSADAVGVEYLNVGYTISDRGGTDLRDVTKEKENMRDDLNKAGRQGWRVKGFQVHAINGGTEFYYLLEKPLK